MTSKLLTAPRRSSATAATFCCTHTHTHTHTPYSHTLPRQHFRLALCWSWQTFWQLQDEFYAYFAYFCNYCIALAQQQWVAVAASIYPVIRTWLTITFSDMKWIQDIPFVSLNVSSAAVSAIQGIREWILICIGLGQHFNCLLPCLLCHLQWQLSAFVCWYSQAIAMIDRCNN